RSAIDASLSTVPTDSSCTSESVAPPPTRNTSPVARTTRGRAWPASPCTRMALLMFTSDVGSYRPGARTTSSPSTATVSTAYFSAHGGSPSVQVPVFPPLGLACLTVAAEAEGASASSSAAASAGQNPLPIRRLWQRIRRCAGGGRPKPRDTLDFRAEEEGCPGRPRGRRAGNRAGGSRAGRERLTQVAAGAGSRGGGCGPARGRAAAHDRHGGVRRAAAHVADETRRRYRCCALSRLRRARARRHVVPGRHRCARQHGARRAGHAGRALPAAGTRVERLLASHEPVHPPRPGLRAARLGGGHRHVPDAPVRADSAYDREPSLAREAGTLPPVRARNAADAAAGAVVQARAASARAVAVLPVGAQLPPLRP